MEQKDIVFWQRRFPSANSVLIKGAKPVLVDTGFGSDFDETKHLLHAAGVPPETLSLIVNTHYHSDHVGGNWGLQQTYGIPIAAHSWEAALVNRRDREACCANWLDQPVEPYRVDITLTDGDELPAGDTVLQVIHTPGHTLGHISLYLPEHRLLICGDAFHRNDVGWLNMFREGAGALAILQDTLDRLAALPIDFAYSGHGPAIEQPQVSIDEVRRRLESWSTQPEKLAWHACKRIFAYALIIKNGLPVAEAHSYLLSCDWFHDFSRHSFQTEPAAFVQPLLDEMIRSKAAIISRNVLYATADYTAPSDSWNPLQTRPQHWS
ncbi:MBL fold metallo-hydrolase [Brevibacillus sp. H7]|jgi:hydroxyacylglutathione hydrolase|uniref:MBL fold metallo-hydrolase n=1 Tax=Brevibacillus sp. H7 TaxID=3349138 RepID=UPI0038187429